MTYSVILASAIVILGGIHCARGVLSPFFLSAFFAVLLLSPVNWLKSKGLKSWSALTIVVIGVAVVGIGAMTIVGTQIAQFAVNLPSYRDRFNKELNAYNLDLGEFIPLLKSDSPDDDAEAEGDEEAKAAYLNELRWRDEYEKSKLRADRPDADGVSTDPSANKTFIAEPQNAPEIHRTSYLSTAVSPYVTEARADELAAGAPSEALISNADLSEVDLENDLNPGLTPPNPPSIFSKSDDVNENGDAALYGAFNVGDLIGGDETERGDELKKTVEEALGDELDDPSSYRPKTKAVSAVDASSQELFRFLRGLMSELSYFGSNAFLVTLFVIFMLCETAKIPQKLVAVIGKRRFTNSHIEGVIADIRNYMVIKTFMSLIVGGLVCALCFVSRVQFPVLWGFVAFLLNYIPNIGSVAAAVPPIVLATIDHGLLVGGIDAAFLVAINCGVGYGLEPRLLGDGLDLSPLIVLIALIFFGWLLGPVGMFLSPPLAVIMKIVFQAFPETQWIAALMANRPPKTSVDEEELSAEA